MPNHHTDQLVTRLRSGDDPTMDEIVDAIIADSGGDSRQAIVKLVELNRALAHENQVLSGSMSQGFNIPRHRRM